MSVVYVALHFVVVGTPVFAEVAGEGFLTRVPPDVDFQFETARAPVLAVRTSVRFFPRVRSRVDPQFCRGVRPATPTVICTLTVNELMELKRL